VNFVWTSICLGCSASLFDLSWERVFRGPRLLGLPVKEFNEILSKIDEVFDKIAPDKPTRSLGGSRGLRPVDGLRALAHWLGSCGSGCSPGMFQLSLSIVCSRFLINEKPLFFI
jgi:hypothetical protein